MSINNMIYAYYTLTNFFRQCWNVLIHQTLLKIVHVIRSQGESLKQVQIIES